MILLLLFFVAPCLRDDGAKFGVDKRVDVQYVLNEMNVRQHPYPVKRQAFRLYAERFPVAEISRRIKVPVHTLYGWVEREGWSLLRDEVTLNLRDELAKMLRDAATTLTGAIRTASKILSQVESQLDRCDGSEVPQIDSQRSDLAPKDLAVLAGALKDASEVLLRVFSK
jgi:hypothetical protein